MSGMERKGWEERFRGSEVALGSRLRWMADLGFCIVLNYDSARAYGADPRCK